MGESLSNRVIFLRKEGARGPRMAAAPEPAPRRAAPGIWTAGSVDEHMVTLLAPTSFEAAQFRSLQHALQQALPAGAPSVVAVSSPGVGDGKTTTAVNLAGALAQAPEARVLLVDADLRRPSVTGRLGLPERAFPGLADLIEDATYGLDDAALRLGRPGLEVLPAGRAPADAYLTLQSPRLGAILRGARDRYDKVVLDAPPLLAVPDCRLLSRWIDGFVIVVAAHRTPRKLVEEALDVTGPDKTIGLVFNGDDRPLSGYSKHYGPYGYYARPAASRAGRRPSSGGRFGA